MMTTTPSPAATAPRFKAWLIEQKSLIALLVLILVVSFLSPNFFTADNLLNILRQTSVNAIMAVGMTLVILTAGIDLSVGSMAALIAGAMILLMNGISKTVSYAHLMAAFSTLPNHPKKFKRSVLETALALLA